MTSYFYKMTINVHQTNIAMCVPEILLAIVIDRKRSFSHKKIEPRSLILHSVTLKLQHYYMITNIENRLWL